jgi:hypothetical protein
MEQHFCFPLCKVSKRLTRLPNAQTRAGRTQKAITFAANKETILILFKTQQS